MSGSIGKQALKKLGFPLTSDELPLAAKKFENDYFNNFYADDTFDMIRLNRDIIKDKSLREVTDVVAKNTTNEKTPMESFQRHLSMLQSNSPYKDTEFEQALGKYYYNKIGRKALDMSDAKVLERAQAKELMLFNEARRQERATKLGFPDPLNKDNWMYRGVRHESGVIRNDISFASSDPVLASRFAGKKNDLQVTRGNVSPVVVNVKNTFDFRNKSHRQIISERLKKNPPEGYTLEEVEYGIRKGIYNFIENDDVIEAIKKSGFDSFYVRELEEDMFFNMAQNEHKGFRPDQVDEAIQFIEHEKQYWSEWVRDKDRLNKDIFLEKAPDGEIIVTYKNHDKMAHGKDPEWSMHGALNMGIFESKNIQSALGDFRDTSTLGGHIRPSPKEAGLSEKTYYMDMSEERYAHTGNENQWVSSMEFDSANYGGKTRFVDTDNITELDQSQSFRFHWVAEDSEDLWRYAQSSGRKDIEGKNLNDSGKRISSVYKVHIPDDMNILDVKGSDELSKYLKDALIKSKRITEAQRKEFLDTLSTFSDFLQYNTFDEALDSTGDGMSKYILAQIMDKMGYDAIRVDNKAIGILSAKKKNRVRYPEAARSPARRDQAGLFYGAGGTAVTTGAMSRDDTQ